MYKLSRLMLALALGLFAYCAVLGVIRIALLVPPEKRGLIWTVAAAGTVAVLARKRGRRFFTSGGTAAWARARELAKKGFLTARTGLIVGRVPCEGTPLGGAVWALVNPRLGARDACGEFFASLSRRKRKQGHLVKLPHAVHTSVYAPTGLGKGAALIVPFLKTCEESCIVVDGKDGELARLTAATRRKMGHQVILLDPSRLVTNSPDTLNLLDFIDRDSPQAVNEAAAIANALVIRTGEEKEPHWLDKAEAYLRALIATTVWYGDPALGTRSLLNVAEIASHPEMLKTALQLMQESPEVWNGSLARMGGMLRHSVGDELSSTLSTVGRFISFMNVPSAAESLKSSSFDLTKLRNGNERVSIYLIQRAADSRTAAPLLRLWLNACIREVMKGGLRHA